MTAFATITSGQIDAESYIDTTLAGQWSNNLLATIEGDATAPEIMGITGAGLKVISEYSIPNGTTNVDFTGLNTTAYAGYIATFHDLQFNTAGITIYHQIYDASVLKTTSYAWSHVRNGTPGTGTTADFDLTPSSIASASDYIHGYVWWFSQGGHSAYPGCIWNFAAMNSGIPYSTTGAGVYQVTTASINGFRFLPSASTFKGGTIRILAVKKA